MRTAAALPSLPVCPSSLAAFAPRLGPLVCENSVASGVEGRATGRALSGCYCARQGPRGPAEARRGSEEPAAEDPAGGGGWTGPGARHPRRTQPDGECRGRQNWAPGGTFGLKLSRRPWEPQGGGEVGTCGPGERGLLQQPRGHSEGAAQVPRPRGRRPGGLHGSRRSVRGCEDRE